MRIDSATIEANVVELGHGQRAKPRIAAWAGDHPTFCLGLLYTVAIIATLTFVTRL